MDLRRPPTPNPLPFEGRTGSIGIINPLHKKIDLKAIPDVNIYHPSSMSHHYQKSRIERDKEPRDPMVCICGKAGLKHGYTIKNKLTGRVLSPVCTECILNFELMGDTNEFRSAEHRRDHLERAKAEVARLERHIGLVEAERGEEEE